MNEPETILTAQEDIYEVMRKIVLYRSPITLYIDGSENAFHSAMTKTDFKSNSFFFDRVIPDKGNALIKSGKRFKVEAETDGINIAFNANGRLRYQPSKECYRAEFPSQLFYRQRRSTYRVDVPESHKLDIKIIGGAGQSFTGKLENLSSSGFKASFTPKALPLLQKTQCFEEATLTINRSDVIPCTIGAHLLPQGNPDAVVCGFSFVSIAPMGQRYIDRLITEFQWEERNRREQGTDGGEPDFNWNADKQPST